MRWPPFLGQSGALHKVERHETVARETHTKSLARPRGYSWFMYLWTFFRTESASTEN